MTIGKRIQNRRKDLGLSADELANYLGKDRSTIYRYESNDIEKLPTSILEPLAKALKTTPAYLMGWAEEPENIYNKYDIRPIKTKKIPMLGNIACGKPIMCEQDYETYIEASADIKADFCLTAKGESMINARIFDGDVVFIKECPMVENGEIAAVIIDNEATLKRVYLKSDRIILRPENPVYDDIIYEKEEMNNVRILGKAVAFQSLIR